MGCKGCRKGSSGPAIGRWHREWNYDPKWIDYSACPTGCGRVCRAPQTPIEIAQNKQRREYARIFDPRGVRKYPIPVRGGGPYSIAQLASGQFVQKPPFVSCQAWRNRPCCCT